MHFGLLKIGGDMKNLMRYIAVFPMFLLLFSCASQTDKPLFNIEESLVIKGYNVVGPVTSINNYRINGWSYVSDKYVIINTGVRDHYLVSFRNSCFEAQSATRVGFSNTAGRLTTSDKMIVEGMGGFANHCFIQSLTRLERAPREEKDD
jgi:hypothetical protein